MHIKELVSQLPVLRQIIKKKLQLARNQLDDLDEQNNLHVNRDMRSVVERMIAALEADLEALTEGTEDGLLTRARRLLRSQKNKDYLLPD